MEKVIYKIKEKEIEFKLDLERHTLWTTQNEIANFYNLDRSVIGKYLKEELQSFTNIEAVCAKFAHTGTDNKVYNVKHYSLSLILEIGYKIDVNKTLEFKDWANNLLDEQRKIEIVKTPMPVEIFDDGDVKLEVYINPNEETIWLTQEQISLLFKTDRSSVSKHIKNILNEEELDESNVQKLHIPFSDKLVNVYNLNFIISIGFRVNSKRATMFRIWSNKILKQYLTKGYAIDESRVTMYKENYIELNNTVLRLENKVDIHDKELNKYNKRITELESKKKEEINSRLFYKGELYDAYSFIVNLIKKAKKEIVLIDNYVDNTTLDILSNKNTNVKLTIITTANLTITSINSFNKQYPTINVKNNNTFHDRFLILDNSELYLIGASIKDAGKKCFGVSKMSKIDLNKLMVLV